MLRGYGGKAESFEEVLMLLDLAKHELLEALRVTANRGAQKR
jgi:hypothetical protein